MTEPEKKKHPMTKEQMKAQIESLDPIKPGHPAYLSNFTQQRNHEALKQAGSMMKCNSMISATYSDYLATAGHKNPL